MNAPAGAGRTEFKQKRAKHTSYGQRPVTANGNGSGEDRRVRLEDTEREPIEK